MKARVRAARLAERVGTRHWVLQASSGGKRTRKLLVIDPFLSQLQYSCDEALSLLFTPKPASRN
eukprot:137562-Rhodomonas_salina.4